MTTPFDKAWNASTATVPKQPSAFDAAWDGVAAEHGDALDKIWDAHVPSVRPDATATRSVANPIAQRGNVLERALDMGFQAAEHPLDTAAGIVTAIPKAASTGVQKIAQSAAEMSLPEDVRHFAYEDPSRISDTDAAFAAAQLATGPLGRLAGAAPAGLARAAATTAVSAGAGAAFTPDDPAAGALGFGALGLAGSVRGVQAHNADVRTKAADASANSRFAETLAEGSRAAPGEVEPVRGLQVQAPATIATNRRVARVPGLEVAPDVKVGDVPSLVSPDVAPDPLADAMVKPNPNPAPAAKNAMPLGATAGGSGQMFRAKGAFATGNVTRRPASTLPPAAEAEATGNIGERTVPPEPVAPVTAYHGAAEPFTAFDASKIGSSTDDGLLGRGFYLSTDSAIGSNKPVLLRGNVGLSNPLRVSMSKWGQDKSAIVRDALSLPPDATPHQITEAAQRAGHDGVVLDYSPLGYRHQEIAVFDAAKVGQLETVRQGEPPGLDRAVSESTASAGRDLNAPSRVPEPLKPVARGTPMRGTNPEGNVVTDESASVGPNLSRVPEKVPETLYRKLTDHAVAAEYRQLQDQQALDQQKAVPPQWNEARDAEAVAQIENRRVKGKLSDADKKRLDMLQGNQGERDGQGVHDFESQAAESRVNARQKHIDFLETEMRRRGLSTETAVLGDVAEPKRQPNDWDSPDPPSAPPAPTLSSRGDYPASWDTEAPKDPKEFLRYATFGLDKHPETILRDKIDALRESGHVEKTYKSLAEQQQEAHAFATKLLNDPLGNDPAKLGRLSGAEQVGIAQVISEQVKMIEGLTHAIDSGELNAVDTAHASALLDRANETIDRMAGKFVKEREMSGRDLGAHRMMAHLTTDPAVWIVRAKKMLDGAPMSDALMTEIRKLANAAKAACL